MQKKFSTAIVASLICITAISQDYNNTQYLSNLENARKYTAEKNWTEAVPLWEAIVGVNPVN